MISFCFFHYVVQVGLELEVSCLSLLSAGITSVFHYAWLKNEFFTFQLYLNRPTEAVGIQTEA
jgi:hypothetical protein